MGWNADSRLAERIRERVAQIVLFELQDPRIGFLTVTRVRLARDLSICEVFYSVLGGDGDRSKAKHALTAASGHVQRELGRILRTKTIPRLSFQYDPAIDGQFRLEGLLDGLKKERGEADSTKPGDSVEPSDDAPPDEALPGPASAKDPADED